MTAREWVSKGLLIAGALCVSGSVLYEVCRYPWQSVQNNQVNEIALPDPSPPEIAYTRYADLPQVDDLDDIPIPHKPLTLPLDNNEAEEADGLDTLPVAEVATERPAAERFTLLGYIKIPRINLSENLFEGTEHQMNYGIGHIKGTAMPGERGNCAVAGHRTSSSGVYSFKYLDQLQEGDLITLQFNDETFVYEVYDTFIVNMNEVWVLESGIYETHMLTLITCDPLLSVGKRVDRLIVRARLTEG